MFRCRLNCPSSEGPRQVSFLFHDWGPVPPTPECLFSSGQGQACSWTQALEARAVRLASLMSVNPHSNAAGPSSCSDKEPGSDASLRVPRAQEDPVAALNSDTAPSASPTLLLPCSLSFPRKASLLRCRSSRKPGELDQTNKQTPTWALVCHLPQWLWFHSPAPRTPAVKGRPRRRPLQGAALLYIFICTPTSEP